MADYAMMFKNISFSFLQTGRIYKTHVDMKTFIDLKSTNLSLSHEVSVEVPSYNIQMVKCYYSVFIFEFKVFVWYKRRQ